MSPLSSAPVPKVDFSALISAATVDDLRKRVKEVATKDGKIVPFEPQKIINSVWMAFRRVQVHDLKTLQKATDRVVEALDRHFNGHMTPTTQEIKEVVALTLIQLGQSSAARWYLLEQSRFPYPPQNSASPGKGLEFRRYFTKKEVHPYEEIDWEKRDATITNEKGAIVFEQKGVEVPKVWSQTATNIVVSKYFRGQVGKEDRESSARQVVDRVAKTIAGWGRTQGYFKTVEDADTFEAELTHLLINQKMAFNSPVWFNVGISDTPQCSACFINSVDDDMRSIMNLAVTEAMLFKYGSGAGSNLSKLRSSKEYLNGSNGRSSGPVRFMLGYDTFAGVVKSGGKTRRAAKMVILNVDHPDIVDFVECKAREEKKAHALIAAGYEAAFNSDSWNSAYGSIAFQNANHSVRVTDEFMASVESDREFWTKYVTTGEPCEKFHSRELMEKMARSAWECGDPGVQYDGTIQKWNPCKASDRINATNPCSEYVFLDDTACNLASLNLMKFRKADDAFDVESFTRATEVTITAMEIVVDNSSYPTPMIEQNSYDFRPLGIGYANLGSLLMARGLPYDSAPARNLAAAITSLLSGVSYRQSSVEAREVGAFNAYKKNEKPFLEVIGMHRDASYKISSEGVEPELLNASRACWDEALALGRQYGFRNAQISVLAPTGTISFLMDCDTTGIEPDIALVKYKWLVGGGLLKLVNGTVPEALTHLGYADAEKQEILDYIDAHDTIEGAPHLKLEHLPVFDCAFKPAKGERSIQYMGHVRMMSAVQPFISGAISKTVNMPEHTTVEEIAQTYIEGWKMGLKAIAIYRDGCKKSQPLTTSAKTEEKQEKRDKLVSETGNKQEQQEQSAESSLARRVSGAAEPERSGGMRGAGRGGEEFIPRRRRLQDERRSITHKFSIGNHEGYITVGLYDDGSPGEIFISMSKEGSVISGLMDAFATSTSIGLQYGVPLKVLVNKFAHYRFEPSGYTGNPQIRMAKSVIDYLFRWLAMKFLPVEDQRALGIHVKEETKEAETLTDMAEHSLIKTPSPLEGEAPSPLPSPVGRGDGGEGIITAAQQTIFNGRTPNIQYPISNIQTLTMTFDNQSDAPVCDTCGAMMVRNAACYKCLNCGSVYGCS